MGDAIRQPLSRPAPYSYCDKDKDKDKDRGPEWLCRAVEMVIRLGGPHAVGSYDGRAPPPALGKHPMNLWLGYR
eukprot:scaffold24789_cov122-Isochrysis_galbana.AAC.3